jgi:hypothetical protein
MHFVRAALAVLFVCTLQAQPQIDFRTRFGPPRAEWFSVEPNIQLRIEYSSSGTLCAARIASPDYRAQAAVPNVNMDNTVVDSVLEAIVPGILTDKSASMLAATMSRNTLISGQYRGVHLSRHNLWTDGKDETVVATLDARPNCLSSSGPSLDAKYGPPEYEEFTVPGNFS